MKKQSTLRSIFSAAGTALAFVMAVFVLAPGDAQAALKCEEMTARRFCSDGASRSVSVGPGQSVMLNPPVIDGYPSACWSWTRRFQCIETNPQLYCDSGTPYPIVKQDCSLTSAAVKATVVINGLQYITDADYQYRCAFGAPTTSANLPPNKECIAMASDTVQSDYVASAPVGSTPPAALTTQIPTKETKTDSYVCYSPPVTTCSTDCFKDTVNKATGQIEQTKVACESPVDQCVTSNTQCNGSISGNKGNPSIGPDGRCINSTVTEICASGPVPKCLSKDNCAFDGATKTSIQDNGFALTQEQSYVCSNTTKTCTEMANISNCVHVSAWGWDELGIKNQIGQGLGEFNQAMSQLEGIEKGIQDDDPYIFSGKDLRCHYAVGSFINTFIAIVMVAATFVITGGTGLVAVGLQNTALMGAAVMTAATANAVGAAVSIGAAFLGEVEDSKAFGGNCCKELVIEGSDRWYKIGKCTGDEVKLAVAKKKGLTVYLGEYCSKKGGFPIRGCVQKTRSYCAFDDMLALVVNEQGRAQLDAMAMADPASTSASGAVPFQFYAAAVGGTTYANVMDNGKWISLTSHNGSKVLSWQYPGYCRTAASQAAAYLVYENEINKALDSKGQVNPSMKPEMTKEEAKRVLTNITKLKPFQECPSAEGTASFMTCDKKDDSCNMAQLPEGPSGVEFDYSGQDVSQADVNWRVQQMRSFYKPGEYGVTATMPGNPSFAAVTTSLSPYVSAVGSCKAADGSCFYQFGITSKTANGGGGAKKRTKENIQFPLYNTISTANRPGTSHVSESGVLDMAGYMADPNRGLATPTAVSRQRFIFNSIEIRKPVKGSVIHPMILVEYANKKLSVTNPADDYRPLMVPTNLPLGSGGWFPYGNTGVHGEYFYLYGGCDPNSRYCNYTVEADLNIARHPWGTAKEPRCWGFTIEQMTALDFDKMDLSRWINSLDLDVANAGLSAEAAEAMTDRTIESAQSFYTSIEKNQTTPSKVPGTIALVTSADILPKLSGNAFEAFLLEVAVPSNWPSFYLDKPNTNPVTNGRVDWGDGSPVQNMILHPEGRAVYAAHDYGDIAPDRYKITVTIDTKFNGPQKLTTHVTVTPDQGGKVPKTELDFEAPGSVGKLPQDVNNATSIGGVNQAPANLDQLSPGTVKQFEGQGPTIQKPPPKP